MMYTRPYVMSELSGFQNKENIVLDVALGESTGNKNYLK